MRTATGAPAYPSRCFVRRQRTTRYRSHAHSSLRTSTLPSSIRISSRGSNGGRSSGGGRGSSGGGRRQGLVREGRTQRRHVFAHSRTPSNSLESSRPVGELWCLADSPQCPHCPVTSNDHQWDCTRVCATGTRCRAQSTCERNAHICYHTLHDVQRCGSSSASRGIVACLRAMSCVRPSRRRRYFTSGLLPF